MRYMDRRSFNISMLSGAALAVAPLGAVSAASQAHAAVNPSLYSWAAAIAKAQNRASPAMLARQLRISSAAAQQLYGSLIANGVIRAPLFGGVARAAQPLYRGGRLTVVPANVSKVPALDAEQLKSLYQKIEIDDAPPSEDGAKDQAT